jgi:hypothetical protein
MEMVTLRELAPRHRFNRYRHQIFAIGIFVSFDGILLWFNNLAESDYPTQGGQRVQPNFRT